MIEKKFTIFCMLFLILSTGLVNSATSNEPINKDVGLGFFENLGNLIGKGFSLIVDGVNFKKEGDNSVITFKEKGASANIDGNIFKNIDFSKLSLIELDKEGEIIKADLTASEDTSFNFNGKGTCFLTKGNRVTYENGKMNVYKGAGKDSFKWKPDVKDESGNAIGNLMNIKMYGDFLNIEKTGENSIITGNLDIGENKIKGLVDGAMGKVTLSKTGRVSEVWKGTDATIFGVTHKTANNNLKISYDEVFDVSSNTNKNYFNYGKNKVSLGGDGFTTKFQDTNKLFGDMKTSKNVQGIGTKTRNLEITMRGGNLEINKDTSKSDLSFNIKSDGDYMINNGRAVIYSEKAYVIENGKRVLSDESSVFIKTNQDKEGLLYSYDINFNEGEYKLENNVLTNKKGNVLVNINTPWEDIVYDARKIDLKEANILKSEMVEKNKLIYTDDPNFLTWIKSENGESLMKAIYTSAENANKNEYGVEVSFLDVYNTLKSEGAGSRAGITPLFQKYIDYPEEGIFPVDFGLTTPGDIRILSKGGFVSEKIKLIPDVNGGESKIITKDAFDYFAGVLAYKKYLFIKDFKELYGDEKLTHDEETYWTTYYFNAGEGNGKKALKSREKNYIEVWEGGRPKEVIVGNPKFNARIRNDFEEYLKELGLFSYP